MWPGVQGLAPSTWVTWLASGDQAIRGQGLTNLAARSWELTPFAWRSTIALRQAVMGRWFAVTAFFDPDGHRVKGWYVDFQKPPTRSRFGLDTRDLFVDLVVGPDFSVRWKDEGEYDRAVTLGLLTDDERAHVADARKEALELVRSRRIMRGSWEDWRPGPSWAAPVLPADVLGDITSEFDGEST